MAEGMTELYQLFYKDEQKEKLLPFAIPYKTEGLTIFFENDWISKLVSESNAEKVGVTSWKLRDKMRARVGLRVPLSLEVLNSDYEVLSLTKNSKKHTMLAHLYHWHPSSKQAMELLWQKLGFKLCGEVKNPIYQNHYVAKREIYSDYVTNFLNPAMELIKTDEELNKLMMSESNYGKLNREADIRSVKAKLGINWYPLCPFILERCPSAYFDLKGYKITYL
jgi:hypothetical protein